MVDSGHLTAGQRLKTGDQRVIIEYEGQRYEFDFDKIRLKQGIKIEKHTGMDLSEWGRALSPEEGKSPSLIAMQALGWLILYGGRDDVPVDDCDFEIVKLGEAFTKAAEEEAAREKAAEEAAIAASPTLPPLPPNGSGGEHTPVLSHPSSPAG
jgi:hypothetical protein